MLTSLVIILFLKILESFAYFITSLNIILYLRFIYDYDIADAELLFSVWGICIGCAGAICGPLIDRLGIRNSLILGSIISSIGRCIVTFASSKTHILIGFFVVEALGLALGVPVLTIAIKRHTNVRNRGFYFGLFYSCMNVGALFAGLVTDMLRVDDTPIHHVSHAISNSSDVDVMNHIESTYREIMGMAFVFSCIYSVLILCFVPNDKNTDMQDRNDDVQMEHVDVLSEQSIHYHHQQRHPSLFQKSKAFLHDGIFIRLVGFSMILFGAQSVMRHMEATLPTYLLQVIGPQAHFGLIYAINPAINIIGVPLIQHYLSSEDIYTVITVGSLVIALSPLVLYFVETTYYSAAVFVIIASLGEAIYSPKCIEYAMALAPDKSEGLYGTLAAAPLFVSKMLVGFTSGQLLQKFCTGQEISHCNTTWLYISLIALTSPILLINLKKYIYTIEIEQRITTNNV